MNYFLVGLTSVFMMNFAAQAQMPPAGAFRSRYHPAYWQIDPPLSDQLETTYPANGFIGTQQIDSNPTPFHISEPRARNLTNWFDVYPLLEQPQDFSCDTEVWIPSMAYTHTSSGSISSTTGTAFSTTAGLTLSAHFAEVGVSQNWTTSQSNTLTYSTDQSDTVTSQITVSLGPCENGRAIRQKRVETVFVAYDNFDARITGVDSAMINMSGDPPAIIEDVHFEMGYVLSSFIGSFDYLKHIRLKILPSTIIPDAECGLDCNSGGSGGDMDGDGLPDGDDDDMDGDGITNDHDNDTDGVDGNNDGSNFNDPDDDNDGIPDVDDDDPTGPAGSDDIDGDGIPNDRDLDVDGDETLNQNEAGPDGDIDGDSIINSEDGDIDGDGTPNENDESPYGNQIVDFIFIPGVPALVPILLV